VLPEIAIWSLPASTLAGAVRVVVVLDIAEELLTRLELELLEALELNELDELLKLELELTELELLELKELELKELELTRLAAELLVVVGGGLDLVPPLPPPQAVKVKLKILAIKTGLMNLIIVSGIRTAPLLSCYRQNQKPLH
jgi:hypothetical protein